MTIRDRGMLADDQFGTAVRVMSKMTRRAEGKPSDPIGASNSGVRLEMKEIDVFTNGRGADLTALFHDQASRKNPRQPNARSRMDLVTELFFEKRTPQIPGQKETEQHQCSFHNCAPRLR